MLVDSNYDLKTQNTLYLELATLYANSKHKPNEVQFAICYQLPLVLVTKMVTHVVASHRYKAAPLIEKPLLPLTKKEHTLVVKKMIETPRLLPLSPIIQLSTAQTCKLVQLFGGLTVQHDQLYPDKPYNLVEIFSNVVGVLGMEQIVNSWAKSKFYTVCFPTIADLSRLFPKRIFPDESEELLNTIHKLGNFP